MGHRRSGEESMTKESEGGGILEKLNFNSAAALISIALGITIFALIPHQVEEPPVFFGQSSSGISPKLFPQIAAVGLIVIGIAYFFTSFRMNEPNGFLELPTSAYVNLAVAVAAMIAYVTLLLPLGYALSSALVAIAFSVYYGSRNLLGIALIGIGAPFAIYYLFTRVLSVSLPPLPWG
jgi:hypothetical protein